ncbi:MAG TPA: hypothetical protein DCG69_09055 [Bacteroidales bacterium]|nr:hypothetical protein [Bacteroidales bacterium]
MNVESFYDQISSGYTKMLERLVPRYSEMLWMILDYIPKEMNPKRIVDLGSGTGNLTEVMVMQYPDAELIAVDLSSVILEESAKRLKKYTAIRYLNSDFNTLDFEPNSVDLVVSTIALHHLTDEQKQKLIRKIYSWLTKDGVFIFGDQFSGSTTLRYQQHMKNWKLEAEQKNIPESEWALWMDHQERHDYHTTIENYYSWCKEAGFENSDVVWKYLLWTVFVTHKNTSK